MKVAAAFLSDWVFPARLAEPIGLCASRAEDALSICIAVRLVRLESVSVRLSEWKMRGPLNRVGDLKYIYMQARPLFCGEVASYRGKHTAS